MDDAVTRNWIASVVLFVLLGALLAGCTSSPTTVASGKNNLTRHVAFAYDVETSTMPQTSDPEQALTEFTQVSFEYKHSGASLDVAGVTVKYQSKDNAATTVQLSTLTSKTKIASGETITISPPDIAMASHLVLEKAGKVVAARSGVEREWFTAGGAPIPIAASVPGTASWDLKADGGLELHVSDMVVTSPGRRVCTSTGCSTPPQTMTLDHLDLTFTSEFDATVEAVTTAPAGGSQLSLKLPSMKEHAEVSLDIAGESNGESVEMTLNGEITATASGRADFNFDGEGALVRVGGEGQVAVHGSAETTGTPDMPVPPRVDFEHKQPYASEAARFPEAVPEELVAFLERMWALDLVPGDEFTFELTTPFGEAHFSSEVMAIEPRTVGSTTRQTFRIVDHFEAVIPDAGLTDLAFDFTHWVDTASYLPVFEQGTITQTFTPADFPGLRKLLEKTMSSSGASFVRFPEDASLTLTTDASLQMTGYTGDFTVASPLAIGGARMVPLVVVGAAVVFVLVNNLGTGSSADRAPSIGVAMDSAGGKLTITNAELGHNWGEFDLNVGKALRFDLNGAATKTDTALPANTPVDAGMASEAVKAGDFFAFCGQTAQQSSVVVQLVHAPTDTMVYQATFTKIAACA